MVKVRTKLGLIMVKVRTKLGLIMVKVIESNLVEMEMHPPSSAARAGLICLMPRFGFGSLDCGLVACI